MPHKLIDTTSVHFQDGYNIVRTPKEAKEYAADVEKQMEQMGDEPASFPINYVVVDGVKYTRNHSTLQAALNRKWDKVYAMESPHAPGSAADYLDLVLSNNRSHPVSRAKQGAVYKMLADGEGPGPEEIAACKTGEEPANKREPMTLEEIAKACDPVYTSQHIHNCIVLAESSPEIQELMESRNVAANVVIKAAGWSKKGKSDDVDPAKQLRIIKAAVKVADDEGNKKVTEKHLNAVKSQFVKLKADKPDDEAGSDETKTTGKKGSSSPATGSDDAGKGDTAETLPEGDSEQEEEQELFTEKDAFQPETKQNKTLKQLLSTVLVECSDEYSWSATDDDVDGTADKIIAALKSSKEVF